MTINPADIAHVRVQVRDEAKRRGLTFDQSVMVAQAVIDELRRGEPLKALPALIRSTLEPYQCESCKRQHPAALCNSVEYCDGIELYCPACGGVCERTRV